MQEQLPEDLLRVDLLFRKAHESGIVIQVNPCFCQMFLLSPVLKKNSLYFFFCSIGDALEICGEFFYPLLLGFDNLHHFSISAESHVSSSNRPLCNLFVIWKSNSINLFVFAVQVS